MSLVSPDPGYQMEPELFSHSGIRKAVTKTRIMRFRQECEPGQNRSLALEQSKGLCSAPQVQVEDKDGAHG